MASITDNQIKTKWVGRPKSGYEVQASVNPPAKSQIPYLIDPKNWKNQSLCELVCVSESKNKQVGIQ